MIPEVSGDEWERKKGMNLRIVEKMVRGGDHPRSPPFTLLEWCFFDHSATLGTSPGPHESNYPENTPQCIQIEEFPKIGGVIAYPSMHKSS